MQKRNKILIALFILALMGLQYFFGPKRVEYKEKVKIVEVVKTEVRTITQKIKSPDGTITETITQETIKEDRKSKEKEVAKKVTPIKKDWLVTGSYSVNNVTTLSVQRRIIFDLYAGVYARTDKEIGVAFTYNF